LNSQCLMPVVKKTSEEDPVHGWNILCK
jgi:hypothetical protein